MIDDAVFPTTAAGMRAAGFILESAEQDTGDAVYESDFGTRSSAMSSVLTWVDEGDYSYDALDETIITAADIDGDFEISEEEEDIYGDIWDEVPNALLTLGADVADVQALVNGPGEEADKAAARVGAALKAILDEEEGSDNDLITDFALADDDIMEGVFEAAYKKKKVIRDGQVVMVRKRVSGKVRLSAAQKAGLRRARRKAHSAAARVKRKKSMKKRKQRGMK